MKKFLLFSIFPLGLLAQPNRPTPIPVSKDPTTVCHNTEAQQYNYVNNNLWACSGGLTPGATGTWTLVSSGGGTPPPSGYSPNQGVSGCSWEYVSGLTFSVGRCVFTVGGQTWTAPALTVTSDAADNTNPRIDQIVASITSTAGVGIISIQKGTAATPPAVPVVDYSTQIPITHYTIAAMATTPTEPTTTLIYDETGGAEWTATASTHFNCASTSNPYHLTKDCEATAAVLTNNVTYVKPAAGTVDLSTFTSLVFYIRSKAPWPTGNSGANAARSISIFWLNGSTQVGNSVILRDGAFGFISSNTTSYQQVGIITGLFGVPKGTLATTLEILISGPTGSASIGFYIDEITLQAGIAPTVPPGPIMNFQGTWSATKAYNPNDVVISGGIGYIALVANTNKAVTNTAVWVPLASASVPGQKIFNLFGPSFVAQVNTETQVTPTGTFNSVIMLVSTGDSLGQYANDLIAIL